MLVLKSFPIPKVDRPEAVSNPVLPQRAMLVTVDISNPTFPILQTLNTSLPPFGNTSYNK